jgi:hypothetical protein
VEILGTMDDFMYFKYHEAKYRENLGKMFRLKIDDRAGWLDDFKDFPSQPENRA